MSQPWEFELLSAAGPAAVAAAGQLPAAAADSVVAAMKIIIDLLL